MSKKPHFRAPFDSEHGKQSGKIAPENIHHIASSLRWKLTWKMS